MTARRSFAALVAGALTGLALLVPRGARADEEVVGWRFGLAPLVGTGAAVVAHAAQLPGFIGLSTLGAEAVGEVVPWGGFLHAEFLSSGQAGRWNALSFAAGVSRRFVGTPTHLSLLARGGIAYQRWNGSSGGCDVLLFVPNSCPNLSSPSTPGTIMTPPPVYSYTGDQLGILAGLRVELPFRPVYVAFDASFVPTVDVDSGTPVAVLGLKLDLVVGFRDIHHAGEVPVGGSPSPMRPARGTQ